MYFALAWILIWHTRKHEFIRPIVESFCSHVIIFMYFCTYYRSFPVELQNRCYYLSPRGKKRARRRDLIRRHVSHSQNPFHPQHAVRRKEAFRNEGNFTLPLTFCLDPCTQTQSPYILVAWWAINFSGTNHSLCVFSLFWLLTQKVDTH